MRLERFGNTPSLLGAHDRAPLPIPALREKPISIWTFDPVRGFAKGALLLACLALTACGGGFGGGGSTGSTAAGSQGSFGNFFGTRPASEVTVTQNEVRIIGPEGYCVDPTGTDDQGATAVVLLGNCAAIPGSLRQVQPAQPAVLLASVGANPGAPIAARLAEMDSYLRSEEGRAALSQSGNAEMVEVLDSFAQEDTLYMRVRDNGPLADPDRAAEHWRAIFDVKGALVTLSVIGLRNDPLLPQAGLETLQAFTMKVQERNGLAAPPPPVAAAPAEDQRQTQPATPPRPVLSGALQRVGFLRRLMG